MKEIWKDIKNYEGYYQVSNFGRVKTLPRKTKNQYSKGLIKKPYKNHGYPRVQLVKDGVKRWKLVHRLVAETFIPNPNNFPQVNHIDGDKANNFVDNLEWCDCLYNIHHALSKGLFRKTSVNQYDLDGNFIKKWDSIINASKALLVHKRSIQNCCANRIKTAGGYIWRYADK